METMKSVMQQTSAENAAGEIKQSPESDGFARNRPKRFLVIPDSKSKNKEVEKLIERMNQEMFGIAEKIKERKLHRENALSTLIYDLHYPSHGFTKRGFRRWNQLDCLMIDLDKLTFANNAYRDKAIIISYSSGEPEINVHNVHERMLHGTNSMAGERRVLKVLNLKKLTESDDSCLSLDEIENRVWGLKRRVLYAYPAVRPSDKAQIIKEVNKLERERERVYANAPVKGKIWNSLPLKKDLQEQIKLEVKEAEEGRKSCLGWRAKIASVQREVKAAEKDIRSLQKKLMGLRQRKDRAYQCILKRERTQADRTISPLGYEITVEGI